MERTHICGGCGSREDVGYLVDATIAALQARVKELEESRDAWKASQECSEKAYTALVNQIPAEQFDYDPINVALLDGAKEQEIIGRKQIADLQAQLTQRTAELEAAKGKLDIILRVSRGEPDDELAVDYGGLGWENDPAVLGVYNLIAELERVRGELAETKEEVKCLDEQVLAMNEWGLTVEKLLLALPKVEGEINERFCTGSYYGSPHDYRSHVTFETALVAILKHRQGMEG